MNARYPGSATISVATNVNKEIEKKRKKKTERQA
jgi:hypothetical protein